MSNKVLLLGEGREIPFSDPNGEIPIVLLNLKRRPDRRASALRGLAACADSTYVFHAYDCHDQRDLEEIECSLDDCGSRSLWQRSLGAYCNRYSLVSILRQMVAHGYPYFAIIEDDILIPSPRELKRDLRFARDILDSLPADIFLFVGGEMIKKTPVVKTRNPISWIAARIYPMRRLFARLGIHRRPLQGDPATILKSAAIALNPVSWAQYTMGTQLNLYSLAGAQSLLSYHRTLPAVCLDEVVAHMAITNSARIAGLLFNPYDNTGSTSDVDPTVDGYAEFAPVAL